MLVRKKEESLLLGRGIQEPDQIYRYFYRYNGLRGNFYFSVNYKDEVEYRHTYLYMHSKPPQSEIDLIHPIMIQIERKVADTCDVPEFKSAIAESCIGVSCD